jgi:hypothetical protein
MVESVESREGRKRKGLEMRSSEKIVRAGVVAVALAMALASAGPVMAGNPTPTGPPASPGPRYTLGDVYLQLTTGGNPGPRTGPFVEPTAPPPTSPVFTVDQILQVAPALDNANGAVVGEVVLGRTFWGLQAGGWGVLTGVMPNNGAVTMTPTMADQAILAGYHNGGGKVVGDAALLATNIKTGATIFGVTGNVIGSTGTAVAANVLAGTTFSNSAAAGIPGAMVDRAATSYTPGTAVQTITAGYYNGSGTVGGDAALLATNIKMGATIFGVAGNVIGATGTAVAANVLATKTFSTAAAAGLTGAMPNNGAVTMTPTTADQAILVGYHNGSGKVVGDAALLATNIKKNVKIFGVVGTYPGAAGVPQTKQTQCTDASNLLGACPGNPAGQDGEFQKGVVWTSGTTRFTDNSNGTVTDNLTGLIWLKNANCAATFGGITKTNHLTWTDALTWSNALYDTGTSTASCGLTDLSNAGAWRLPNVREMQSLIDYGNFALALPTGHPFSNVQSAFYWSSSTLFVDTRAAWLVGLGAGTVDVDVKTALSYFVWPVRGGQ